MSTTRIMAAASSVAIARNSKSRPRRAIRSSFSPITSRARVLARRRPRTPSASARPRVAAIYRQLRQKHKFIAVIGDFNDTPDSDPIGPLFSQTGLKDISELAGFVDGGRPGTFKNSTASNKIDYILLSPDLFEKATAGGIFRLGVWGGTNGTLFPHFPEITKEIEAA